MIIFVLLDLIVAAATDPQHAPDEDRGAGGGGYFFPRVDAVRNAPIINARDDAENAERGQRERAHQLVGKKARIIDERSGFGEQGDADGRSGGGTPEHRRSIEENVSQADHETERRGETAEEQADDDARRAAAALVHACAFNSLSHSEDTSRSLASAGVVQSASAGRTAPGASAASRSSTLSA